MIDEQAYRMTSVMYDELRDPSLFREVLQTRVRGVSTVAKQSSPLPTSAIMYEPKVEGVQQTANIWW
ncbi:hypothetical protein KUH03_38065 [Sphingobacterium sp. E70]|uniref:hypothetical protein n=1 Tax=Sphingobacterium sp. E70 TaxID=2853439 RepID=UPI00211C74ED|nr:hypothetical protein [Sphingobacterium sp. E70]ULT24676.1 hypothetical protein KUH03_38065 [Sphingobacterium sp. E70]